MREHEHGIRHRIAFLKWKLKDDKIKAGVNEVSDIFHVQMQKNQHVWRKILHRVAAAIKFLAKKKNLSLRGHRENFENSFPENVLASKISIRI